MQEGNQYFVLLIFDRADVVDSERREKEELDRRRQAPYNKAEKSDRAGLPAAVKRPESYDGFSAGKSAAEKTADLQSRRQQLQNDLLLTQAAGTDSAGAVADRQKQLEAELKEVSAELRAVKTPCVAPAEKDEAPRADEKPVQLAIRRRMDIYEPGGSRSAESFGAYQMKKGREGYSILFQPYEGE